MPHLQTSRLNTFYRHHGPATGEAVVFVHGNVSDSIFWEETMNALPENFQGIAPDMRGYGHSESTPIDATRGCRDWAEDVLALMDQLEIDTFHAVGHSLGGSCLFTLHALASERIKSLTFICPGSPYGFGGTKGIEGTPTYEDFGGSGGGLANPEFAKRLDAGDTTSDDPQASPRVVMNAFYWKPPFVPAREEEYLQSMLRTKVGDQFYPADAVPSANWPGVGPGQFGPLNMVSPKYQQDTVPNFLAAPNKPPVLWVRGSDDLIVSDRSFFDIATLGQMELVPGYPGVDVMPSQPMIGQTRDVLEKYAASGGSYKEVVIADTGHSPYIEKPEAFNSHFHALLSGK
ncbi:MAG: alpha/beta hydrolase [Bacteroidota bacterium]